MRVAVMQPYFLPYVAYFQLLAAVDKFVVLDDVNYINRGWINRNRVLINGQPSWITIPLCEASQNKKINEIEISYAADWQSKMLRTLELCYRRAPHFDQVMPVLERVIRNPSKSLASFLLNGIVEVAAFLEIQTAVVASSSIYCNQHLKGWERIADICRLEHATEYLNPQGGQEIYSYQQFADRGVDLGFLVSKPVSYQQYGNSFQPWLSIADLLMFNGSDQGKQMLKEFDVVRRRVE